MSHKEYITNKKTDPESLPEGWKRVKLLEKIIFIKGKAPQLIFGKIIPNKKGKILYNFSFTKKIKEKQNFI